MICSTLLAKVTLGTVVACSGLTGAAQATSSTQSTSTVQTTNVVKTTTVKVEQVQKLVIVKTQDEVKKIALSHCSGTVKKVEKNGQNYTITILGTDQNEHFYQVNEQTGNCTLIKVVAEKVVIVKSQENC